MHSGQRHPDRLRPRASDHDSRCPDHRGQLPADLVARRLAITLALAGLIAALATGVASPQPTSAPAPAAGAAGDRFDARRAYADLRRQVDIGPRPAGSRGSTRAARFIRSRLGAAGASGIGTQKRHRNVHATLEGLEPGRTIVVGAHYDTKPGIRGFVGANDGASGVAMLLELARSLPRPLPGASIELVFFDAEEARGERPFHVDGTRGSRLYVRAMQRGSGHTPALSSVEAMVLFDMVGDCDLQIPQESNSDPGLYAAFSEAGADLGEQTAGVFGGSTGPISDDHLPFIQAGIPAVDLIDFQYGPGPPPGDYWHTRKDSLDHVCRGSLDRVGESALLALERLSSTESVVVDY